MPAPAPDNLIDRVNQADEPIGQIRRADAFRLRAGFRVAHVLVIDSEGCMLLQQLAAERDRSPLRWGSSVAAYLHTGESYAGAARRRLREELGLSAPVEKLGDIRMHDDGAIKFISVFEACADQATIADPAHIAAIKFMTIKSIEQQLESEPALFTETFPHVFEVYLDAQRA